MTFILLSNYVDLIFKVAEDINDIKLARANKFASFAIIENSVFFFILMHASGSLLPRIVK